MKRLVPLMKSPSVLVYAGTILRSGFGFLIGLIFAQVFGADGYGLFYTYAIIMTLSLAMGEALDQSLIRFYTYRLYHDRDRAGDVLGSSLALRTGAFLLLIAISLLVVFVVAPGALTADNFEHLIIAGVISGALAAQTTFASSVYICRENFMMRAFLVPALVASRCAVVAICVASGLRDLITILWIDVGMMAAFALVAGWLIRGDLSTARIEPAMARQLVRFSKWSLVITASYLIYMGLGAPVLIYFWSPVEAGIFGAAVSFAVLVEHATAAILSVQHQRASRVASPEELRDFLQKSVRVALIMAVGMIPFGLIGGPLIVLTFGSEFEPSAAIFPVILAGSIIHMITMPRGLVFIAKNQPERIAYATAFGLVAWIIGSLILIPTYAEWGAAFAVLGARIAQGALLLIMVQRTDLTELPADDGESSIS